MCLPTKITSSLGCQPGGSKPFELLSFLINRLLLEQPVCYAMRCFVFISFEEVNMVVSIFLRILERGWKGIGSLGLGDLLLLCASFWRK